MKKIEDIHKCSLLCESFEAMAKMASRMTANSMTLFWMKGIAVERMLKSIEAMMINQVVWILLMGILTCEILDDIYCWKYGV